MAGCGSSASSSTTTTRGPSPPAVSESTTSTIAVSQSTSPPAAGGTENLTITNADRAQLVAAAAALNNVPAADFVGLVPGDTFLAYDGPTATYWAGAKLDPGSSMQAQVSTQDDGSYILFHRPAGANWIAQDVGLAGAGAGGTPCPAVPSTILALWNWGPGTCRPTGI